MSHKSARKSQNAALTEDKEKRQTDSPVKEMKKKIAANAEKEKQAADKTDKTVKSPERTDKNAEKSDKASEKTPNEKADSRKSQNAEKVDKIASTPDKNAQKADKAEKTDKNAENSDKKTEKVADKKDKPAEKKNDTEKKEEGKGDASAKDKPDVSKQNGAANGESNGTGDTVSEPDSSEEDLLVIDDQDEVFPELTYDDTSDADFEEGAPSRSFTRRSQVKATKTPETPRPASVKEDDSKEKLLKMNDSLATDRKLRSADSPKPESKKPVEANKPDSPKKDKTIDLTEDEPEKNEGSDKNEGGKEKSGDTTGKNKLEMAVVIEVESLEGASETRGRTRARVSPYTRPVGPTSASASGRHDLTTSSLTANYTGNNTTMEMDITETSSILEEPNLDDSSAYLRGLRTIKGRTSYKPLKELSLKHTFNRSTRSTTSSANTSSVTESARPTGTVVGRKRKPDAEEDVELAHEAAEEPESDDAADELLHVHSKRMRLLDRFSVPFRGFNSRSAAAIVGINTDLPLTAPVASSTTFDPETLKPLPSPSDPIAVPLHPAPTHDRETKRCIVM